MANMGIPYSEGSTHAAVYGRDCCIVSREKITIDIHNRTEDETRLYGVFHIRYHIESDREQTLPLLFIGKSLSQAKNIVINQRPITSVSIDSLSLSRYSFLSKDSTNGFYYAQYTADEKVPVELDELIYFNAPLQKGSNTILVEYEADFVFNNYGFTDNFQVTYSLYPSRFWKSFGPIELNLNLNSLAEVTDSNLGRANIQGDIYQWNINNLDQDIKIIINYKSSWLAKVLLTITPAGIALFAALVLFYLHFRWMNRTKRRALVKWLGIFLVPILTMVIFLLAYPLIDYVLGKQSRHGYVFLIVLYYPAAVLCYGILIGLANFIFRKK
jgi:uncharacterized beta-barrel protein YwiB (DUF1934 family)